MSDVKFDQFLSRALPSNVIEDNPDLAIFVKKYFEYISQELGTYDSATNLLKYLNVDTTLDAFYEDFKNMYAPLLPEKHKASLSLIVKNIVKFYQTKGTEDSFRTFFQMIFDVTVRIYYPKEDMLRVSDGRWIEPYYLYPIDQDYDTQYYFYDKFIIGSISKATAYVEDIRRIDDPNSENKINTLSLVNRTGIFINGEDITVLNEVTPLLTLHSTDAVIEGIGYWTGTEGFLSWNKYVQDSEFYQDYSYQLESPISTNLFEKAVRDNIHPAGFKFFALVTEGITLVQWGTELASYLDNIIDWIREQDVSYSINKINHTIKNGKVYPIGLGANEYDWKYFEQNRDSTPFLQLYTIASLGNFYIDHVDDNYPEKYVTVTINGSSTTDFIISNENFTLGTALTEDSIVIISTSDLSIPINSRIQQYTGRVGDTTFRIPLIINRMLIDAYFNNGIIV